MRGIDGWFSEDEGRWYARFARSLVGGTFVEVGSWKGRSTSFIAKVCRENGTRLVCVDHYRGSHDGLADRYRTALDAEDVEATFRTNMRALDAQVELVVLPSVEAAKTFAPKSVGRVFLDGSHDEASVAEDLVAWSACLADDGRLAGHDYDDKHPGLVRAVDAFARVRGLTVKRGPRSIFALV